ncbi:hypothetical protein [Cohnella sp. GCM10027633]|uniref:hypothetical protein n=1 Tax=unclassified Cohnella TaxID=2636738 RepID=UPI0036266723
MAVTLCPWCQSEIPVEEGQEPEKYCPVCDNELDGYRTLRVDIGEDEEEEEERQVAQRHADPGDDDDEDDEEEDDEWGEALSFRESGPEGLLLDEKTERLLDEQEFVPECPNCREYMLEAGEQTVPADQFRSRVPQSLGKPILEAPFALTLYVCPACFATQTQLSENGREQMMRGFGEPDAESGGQG